MDYPKSVPGVGLVGGKFVDENAATGQQGSLIPSAWGNAVTEEISNVIKDAGDVPAEGDLSQLQKAIRKIVALVWPKATDVEVAAGAVDDKVVTPKKLRMGFSASLNASGGFIAFPSWLNGFVIQWGYYLHGNWTAAGSQPSMSLINFPIAFPSRSVFAIAMPTNGTTAFSITAESLNISSVTFRYYNQKDDILGLAWRWFSFGW